MGSIRQVNRGNTYRDVRWKGTVFQGQKAVSPERIEGLRQEKAGRKGMKEEESVQEVAGEQVPTTTTDFVALNIPKGQTPYLAGANVHPEPPAPTGNRFKDAKNRIMHSLATPPVDPIPGSFEATTLRQHLAQAFLGARGPGTIKWSTDTSGEVVGHQDLGRGHRREFRSSTSRWVGAQSNETPDAVKPNIPDYLAGPAETHHPLIGGTPLNPVPTKAEAAAQAKKDARNARRRELARQKREAAKNAANPPTGNPPTPPASP